MISLLASAQGQEALLMRQTITSEVEIPLSVDLVQTDQGHLLAFHQIGLNVAKGDFSAK